MLMKPWYEVVELNSLIRSGQLQETEFTADLIDVIEGNASVHYEDPQKFYNLTYLSRGLKRLLHAVQSRLKNNQGNAIIKLQTPFGGGKTHALIAVYHYIKHGQKILDIMPNSLSILNANIVSLGGTHLNPLEGHELGNTYIHTIWGEIAYQLGGKEGYEIFEANDMSRISPGKDKMKKFLQKYKPFLILLDEMVEYITKARGISVNSSNLGTQTLLFLQELTEVIASLSNGLLIITLPVHEQEDFSEKASEIITRMNQILGRVETTETPVERDEVPRLITKRLIKKIAFPEELEKILNYYTKQYHLNRKELPEYSTNPNFLNRMRDCYPFHPELIDTLYDKWRTIPSFQGTRAILRILAKVLTNLWSSSNDTDLICTSNIDLDSVSIRNEFLRHIKSDFDSILNSDILGTSSRAKLMDIKHPAWDNLALKITSSIFLRSFSKRKTQRGITISELKLCLLQPKIQISLLSEVIDQVKMNMWYLHNKQGRLFFNITPNLNRTIQDIQEHYTDTYEEELRKTIKSNLDSEFQSYLWPKSSNDIPDNHDLKLIIIHPTIERNSIMEMIETKGIVFRQYKNRLIFALPNSTYFTSLINQIQTKLALLELIENITQKKDDEESHIHLNEIRTRLKWINNSLSYNVRKAYSTLFDGNITISLESPRTQDESLTRWYFRELTTKDYIVKKLHYKKLIKIFLDSNNFVATKLIHEQFLVNPELIKILSSQVIQECISNGVKEGALGFATLGNHGINADSFRFDVNIEPSEIIFSKEEIILSKDISESISAALKEKLNLKEIAIPLDTPKFSPAILNKIDLKESKKSQRINSLSLEISNIDSKLIPAFYRGVIQPLQSQNAKISLEMKLDIQSDLPIPESIMDTLIPETIDQLGAKIIRLKKDEEE